MIHTNTDINDSKNIELQIEMLALAAKLELGLIRKPQPSGIVEIDDVHQVEEAARRMAPYVRTSKSTLLSFSDHPEWPDIVETVYRQLIDGKPVRNWFRANSKAETVHFYRTTPEHYYDHPVTTLCGQLGTQTAQNLAADDGGYKCGTCRRIAKRDYGWIPDAIYADGHCNSIYAYSRSLGYDGQIIGLERA